MKRGSRAVLWTLIPALLLIGITPPLQAGFSPSEGIGLSGEERASELNKIRQVMERKMVRERLQELGFTSEEVRDRLDRLTDRDIQELSSKIDQLKVAGNGGLGLVIVVLVIAILFVILVKLIA